MRATTHLSPRPLPLPAARSFNIPSPDCALEYWYALYDADSGAPAAIGTAPYGALAKNGEAVGPVSVVAGNLITPGGPGRTFSLLHVPDGECGMLGAGAARRHARPAAGWAAAWPLTPAWERLLQATTRFGWAPATATPGAAPSPACASMWFGAT